MRSWSSTLTRRMLITLLLLALPQFAHADGQWVLQKCTLTYHVSHPLHQVDGVSHNAKGKGVCGAGECNFLIAVPVKSFDSGDSNRDLHMLQVTRGAEFTMIEVRTQFPESSIASTMMRVDMDVQFAGQTAHYKQVPFQLVTQGGDITIIGTVPATLTDFKISAPSLLAMPIKNDIPVKVDMTWHRR